MTTSLDLVQQLERRLRRDGLIDAGLDDILAEAQRSPDASESFTVVQRMLRERIRALEDAAVALGNLSKAVARLRRVFRFTEEGWPHERARIERLRISAPPEAAQAWLDYTWHAAADYRLDALHRLVEDGPLPGGGYDLLRERVRTCTIGLERKNLWLALPVLTEGLTGASTGKLSRAGSALRLLMARLAILAEDSGTTDQVLGQGTGAAWLALRAASARRGGDIDGARHLLSEAEAVDAFDMDVVHEGVRQALALRMPQEARDIAQRGIDVRTSLVDIQHELDKLLEPPAQLWLAVAQRARQEAATEVCSKALERASKAAWEGDDYDRVLGEVLEMRAAMAEGVARARLFLDAGDRWLAVPEISLAREDYESALSAFDRGEDVRLWASLVFRRGDCIAVQASQEAVREVRAELTTALRELTDAQQVPDAASDEPWNYGVEFDLRDKLASCLDEPRDDHLWRGFLAALRSVSLQPEESRSWSSVADAAGALSFSSLAVAAAQASADRSTTDDGSTIAIALVNARRYEESLERLARDESPWADSVRGWIRWRQGEFSESTRLLSSIVIDPLWPWARNAFLSSLLLTGRHDLARTLAEQYAADVPGQPEEFEQTVHAARLSLVTGDLATANSRASEAQAAESVGDEGEASFLLAQVALLTGDRQRARDLIATALRSRSIRPTAEWFVVDRPHLCEVAAMHDLSLDGLDELDALVSARHATLQSQPLELSRQIDDLVGPGVEPTVTQHARALAVAVAAVAVGDLPAAHRALAELPDSLTAERQSLERHVERLTHEPAGDAGESTGLSETGPEAANEETAPEGFAGTSSEAPRVPAPVRLGLPASWFDDYQDPVRQHPIFLRCLPELRERSTVEIPSVRVAAQPDLEPDRYEVVATDSGSLIGFGTLPAGSRFCDEATLALLPEAVRNAARIQVGAVIAVPEDLFGPHDHVLRMITMDRDEAAVAQVGRAVASRVAVKAQPSTTAVEEALPGH